MTRCTPRTNALIFNFKLDGEMSEVGSMIIVNRVVLEALAALVDRNTKEGKQIVDHLESLLAGYKVISESETTTVGYTNYRGEYGVRTLVPQGIYFGCTKWHRLPQWLMRAWDVEKGDYRDFALIDLGKRSYWVSSTPVRLRKPA